MDYIIWESLPFLLFFIDLRLAKPGEPLLQRGIGALMGEDGAVFGQAGPGGDSAGL